jgi:formate--tetrahydrofolate ligase
MAVAPHPALGIRPIGEVAAGLGLADDELEPYGRAKAKIPPLAFERRRTAPDGRLVAVTSITPTPLGEGKTTTAIGLAHGLGRIGERALLCLREPSQGPVFGIKGGGTGGGRAQLHPMADVNLHFTGDIHAVAAATNLLAALVDAHVVHGNALGIDPHSITWRRCLDTNDRALRHVVTGLGGRTNGSPRETGFDIAAASEVMAILAIAADRGDLRRRLGAITVATDEAGDPVTAEDLRAAGSMAALLRDAAMPNLVQTLEGRPALVHAGPFANIAHGNNSLLATRLGLKLADWVVTESGFGSDMGFEKLVDIVCRTGRLRPSAVVLVATAASLRHHGEGSLAAGAANLRRHVAFVRSVGWEPVVAVNAHPGDTRAELEEVQRLALVEGARAAVVTSAFEDGGDGAAELAAAVVAAAEEPRAPRSSTTCATGWSGSSRPSPSAPTAPPGSRSTPRPAPTSSASRRPASASSRCAWPRRRSRSRTTRASSARPPGSRCRSAACARTRAPAGSSRSAALCRRCPGSARRPPRGGSTSTTTARSSACGSRVGSAGGRPPLRAAPRRRPRRRLPRGAGDGARRRRRDARGGAPGARAAAAGRGRRRRHGRRGARRRRRARPARDSGAALPRLRRRRLARRGAARRRAHGRVGPGRVQRGDLAGGDRLRGRRGRLAEGAARAAGDRLRRLRHRRPGGEHGRARGRARARAGRGRMGRGARRALRRPAGDRARERGAARDDRPQPAAPRPGRGGAAGGSRAARRRARRRRARGRAPRPRGRAGDRLRAGGDRQHGRGIELADSWSCDGHKWLNVPYDAGYAICAHPETHERALSYTASYLTGQGAGRDFGGGDFVLESSRRARGFATWAALRSLGRTGVADLVDRCCELAERAATALAAADGIEVANEVVLNQVLVRVGDTALTDEVERRVQADGTAWLGATTWRGERLLRLSISNWSTAAGDVDRTVDAIVRARVAAVAARR